MLAVASTIITDCEISPCEILSPADALRKAMLQVQIGKPMTALLNSFPSIQSACLRLAKSITHLYPSIENRKAGLLAVALRDGLNNFREKAGKENDQQLLPAYFTQALINRAIEATLFDVRAVNEMGEGERWDMFETPLTSWCERFQARRIVFTRRNSDAEEMQAARTMIIGQVLTLNEAKIMHKVSAETHWGY